MHLTKRHVFVYCLIPATVALAVSLLLTFTPPCCIK